MRHLTTKEIEIIEKMNKLDENSPEYKELQKELIEIDKENTDNTDIIY